MKLKQAFHCVVKLARASVLVAALPILGNGQTLVTPTDGNTFTAPVSGVAATALLVVVSNTSDTQNYNASDLSISGVGYSTGGNSVDLGATVDGKTIELYHGSFNIYSGTNRAGPVFSGVTGFSGNWGVSNSFIDQSTGHEKLFIGYTDLSANKTVGLYNLTTSSFAPTFTFTSAVAPTGLGNYSLAGGTTTADQHVLVTFADNTFHDFTAGGGLTSAYFWDTSATGSLQDISYANGNLFGVANMGGGAFVESAAFNIAAVPEPSTYAAVLGMLTLAVAVAARRRSS